MHADGRPTLQPCGVRRRRFGNRRRTRQRYHLKPCQYGWQTLPQGVMHPSQSSARPLRFLKSLPISQSASICVSGFYRLFTTISVLEDNLIRACDQSVFRLSSTHRSLLPWVCRNNFSRGSLVRAGVCRDARSPKAAAFLRRCLHNRMRWRVECVALRPTGNPEHLLYCSSGDFTATFGRQAHADRSPRGRAS